MNKIINMVIRQLTRKLVNKGIDVGINKASTMGRKSQPQGEIDDLGNPVDASQKPSQAQVRQQRQARKAARQAKQAAKIMRRSTRG